MLAMLQRGSPLSATMAYGWIAFGAAVSAVLITLVVWLANSALQTTLCRCKGATALE